MSPDDPSLPPGARRLRTALFASPDCTAYAVVDGAARLDLAATLHDHPAPHACLFIGALDPALAATAPWLIRLDPGAGILDRLLEGWGRGEAIYALSRLGLSDMRRKLRTLTIAELPDGRAVFFRFYDPRVLWATAPLFDATQLNRFFAKGAIETYFLEGPKGEALRFAPDGAGPTPLAEDGDGR